MQTLVSKSFSNFATRADRTVLHCSTNCEAAALHTPCLPGLESPTSLVAESWGTFSRFASRRDTYRGSTNTYRLLLLAR